MNKLTRQLRRNQTIAEKRLWKAIRNRRLGGFKFRRQHRIGRYIVDFVCLERSLIVEVDGGQHSERTDYELERSSFLKDQGFEVLRFWNNEVLIETEGVLEKLLAGLEKPSPHPDPFTARG